MSEWRRHVHALFVIIIESIATATDESLVTNFVALGYLRRLAFVSLVHSHWCYSEEREGKKRKRGPMMFKLKLRVLQKPQPVRYWLWVGGKLFPLVAMATGTMRKRGERGDDVSVGTKNWLAVSQFCESIHSFFGSLFFFSSVIVRGEGSLFFKTDLPGCMHAFTYVFCPWLRDRPNARTAFCLTLFVFCSKASALCSLPQSLSRLAL